MTSPVRLVLAFGCMLLATNVAGAQAPSALTPSLAPMLAKVIPGVVSIGIHGKIAAQENPLFSDPFFRRFFGSREHEFQAAGSGVVVDARRGYILTNNHVVENADEITVSLNDGRRLTAKKIGVDPATDVALGQVAADHLTGVPLGDSDALKVGDYAVAVGNPFGLGETVTFGIVSALGRTGLGIEGYEDFIQTDASINPGNSGGALVNLNGEVVGINTAIVGPSGGNVGIGLAIPINMARDIMDQLIAHGEIKRAQLGVTIQDLTPDLAKTSGLNVETGAVVNEVIAASPAEKAGLQAGDVITKVNGHPISGASNLRNKIGQMPIGSELHITLIRNGASQEVTAVLAEAKAEQRPPRRA
jgi:serine protease DegQ